RQSRISEREGLDLDRSTLADWVGKSTALLEPLADAIGRHLLAGWAIFADDTPVKMLTPGTGKTATARLWAYGRDERPWNSDAPPASWYRFSPDRRVEIRQAKAAPIFDGLESWLHEQLPTISGKSPLAMAIRYGLTRMKRLRPYLDHGFLELDNNTAERAMRSVAVGRKNYLFVGSQTGGRAAAIAYTLIETAKLNGVDPQRWLADTLARIPDYKITRVDELLPWNWSNYAA
ncbi:transposase, partial [Rhodovulum sp. NI22]